MVVAHVFDLFGTLVDPGAGRTVAQRYYGERAESLIARWRQRQLEYSWWLGLMNHYRPFTEVTESALNYALEAENLSSEGKKAILNAPLVAYPEVQAALDHNAEGLMRCVLSNGTHAQIRGALEKSGLESQIDKSFSADEVKTFKPDARVYALVTGHFGCKPSEVVFFSSNSWDIAGAAQFGFTTVWINRTGAPPEHLPMGPTREVKNLEEGLG